MSLNYSIIDTFKLLKDSLKYNIFIAIILCSIIFVLILIINKDSKITKYIILSINIVLFAFINYYYFNDLISLKYSNPLNNIYFYFFNSIIYLIVMSFVTFKNRYKIINYIFYGLVLINLLFALFMTRYLGGHDLIILGNIYPMIKFGNIIYVIYYSLLIIKVFKEHIKKIK